MTDWHDEVSLDALQLTIDGWLERFSTDNPVIAAVDRAEPGDNERRWFVRMKGEEKDFTTIWLTLGQRTLKYETYFMPAPEENAVQLYEHLMRRNDKLVGAHFSIGLENAVYLRGELPIVALDAEEFDRILGSVYVYVEQYFPTAIRIGFASRFPR